MTAELIKAIRVLEQERCQALVDGDDEQLAELLSDKVCYVHTNGKRETKQQVISAIANGRRRYRQIEVQSQDIIPLNSDACIVTGRMLIEMEANSSVLVYPISYTAVQIREQGEWRLLVWQATRYAGD